MLHVIHAVYVCMCRYYCIILKDEIVVQNVDIYDIILSMIILIDITL